MTVALLDKLIATAENGGSEHSHQVAFFAWFAVNRRNFPATEFMFAVPNANSHKQVSEGVRGGVPDVWLPQPSGSYIGLVIEMKIGKNTTSANQDKWLHHLGKIGYKTAVCYSWREAVDVVINYLTHRKHHNEPSSPIATK